MTIPYDYDQTNIDHLHAVIDEQEQTIEYLHECCKAEEVENAKLRELVAIASDMARDYDGDRRLLRELCASLYEFSMSEYPDGTELNFADRMRELGVEV